MSRISDYPAKAVPASDDLVPIVDVHDRTSSADGTTKKTTVGEILAGAVASVNGHTGTVVLAAADVGADASGAASAAQSAAQSFATSAVATETTRAQAAEALALPKAGGTMSGAIAMGANKVTGLANGTTASDAAAFGQIPASLPPNGAAGGALTGSYPSPGIVTVPIGSGGTGQVTQQAALDALAGAVTSGQVLRGNGTHVALAALQAADVPTLNQNTTGTAANVAGGVTLPAYLAPRVATLTFVGGGTTLVDASLGNVFNLTLTASTTTLGNPSSPVDGEVIRVRVIQDATGSRTLAYGTAYDFGAAGAPTLSTGPNKVDILGFEYVASISKWCCLGSVQRG